MCHPVKPGGGQLGQPGQYTPGVVVVVVVWVAQEAKIPVRPRTPTCNAISVPETGPTDMRTKARRRLRFFAEKLQRSINASRIPDSTNYYYYYYYYYYYRNT